MFFIVPVGHCKPIISWHLQDTLEELSLDPPKQPCQEEQQTSQTQILDTMFCTGIAGLWEWSAIPNGLITPGHAAEIRVFFNFQIQLFFRIRNLQKNLCTAQFSSDSPNSSIPQAGTVGKAWQQIPTPNSEFRMKETPSAHAVIELNSNEKSLNKTLLLNSPGIHPPMPTAPGCQDSSLTCLAASLLLRITSSWSMLSISSRLVLIHFWIWRM